MGWAEGYFATLLEARQFADKMMAWYNQEHRHNAISYVTPNQRHSEEDSAILAQRAEVYEQARAKNPNRWSGKTRNWRRKEEVHLNPHRVEQVRT